MKGMNFVKHRVFLWLLCLTLAAAAEESPKTEKSFGWNNQVISSLNFSQTSFDNWTKGGENNVSWLLNIEARFERKQEKYTWANSGKFSYGKNKVGLNNFRKSVDEIKLSSVYKYRSGIFVDPYASFSFETQFVKGYDYQKDPPVAVSNFMDPAYVFFSGGAGIQPNPALKMRFGFAFKTTITDKYPLYADNPRTRNIEKIRYEPGGEAIVELNRKISKNILLTSKAELFSNMRTFREIDVRWDTTFSSKIAKYVSVIYNIQLFYDSDVSPKRQLKQVLAVGLTYELL
ncbi:MAG: DUF3078 domain-containing protein [Calditrichaeota bacterium]|nr:DUF3078 domain-containing protein [Calditrichota bacterium]